MNTNERSKDKAKIVAKIVALYHMVSGGISMGLMIKSCLQLSHKVDEWEETYRTKYGLADSLNAKHERRISLGRTLIMLFLYTFLVAGIIFSLVWLIMGIILLYGVVKKKVQCLLNWVMFTFVSLFVSVISLALTLAMRESGENIILKLFDIAQVPLGISVVEHLRRDFENNISPTGETETVN